jgi:hypothetical protein
MAKIEITKTELVWPGKYKEDGTLKEVPRASLPFQVIERVNESRATREAREGGVQQTHLDVREGKEGDTFEAGWRNKLIRGDNLLVISPNSSTVPRSRAKGPSSAGGEGGWRQSFQWRTSTSWRKWRTLSTATC